MWAANTALVSAQEEEEEVEEEIDFSDANGFSSPLIRRFFQVGSVPPHC